MTEIGKNDADGEPVARGAAITVPVDHRRFNRNLLIFLIAFELLLVLADTTINYQGWISVNGIRRMANIAREDGFGTWFMSVQTLFAGLTVLLVYLASRRTGEKRRTSLAWLVVSLFLFFMAADDATQIHERLGSAYRHYAETGAGVPGSILDFFPSYTWQLILLPFFGALGLFMLVFVWTRLKSNKGKAKLIIALDLFVLAVFIDFIEGLEPESRLNIFTRIIDNTSLGEDFVYHYAKVIEEFMEMLGMTLLLSMFFMYLAGYVQGIGFSFENRDETAAGR